MHHHVWQLPLTSLDTPVHALDQDPACTRQNSHAQTRPGTPMPAPVHARRAPWTRQSVTRADAPRPHSPAPLASGRARRPATSQTSSIDRGNAMANVIVDATRHGDAHSRQAHRRLRVFTTIKRVILASAPATCRAHPLPLRHGAREHEVLPAWEWGLIFEHDLNALSDHLGRPHPSSMDRRSRTSRRLVDHHHLRGGASHFERILFSFMESNWLDGLARAWEGLARLCGMSGEALKHPHLARRNSAGEPMDMSSHPELKHHVEHLDFMLYHTQQDLDHSREYANQTHARIIEQGDAIKMLANDRRTLRQQRAKRDATITRLRAKIAALEATVKAQEEQMKKMEEDGEDIQGGSNYLSDDNDFEEDENTEGEDYDFLDDEDDDHTPIDVDEEEE
ncbi:hypothetical protein QYE76_008505 [Lolium multiflorum]|uniref:Uncharacterized protein n=1 Tax=Lolium multiflorum TaxID=4521 RepID=A0AAD8TT96_LOLMU|nr:hypothetical protein QYE76_008505 [Lolium multiflorum]